MAARLTVFKDNVKSALNIPLDGLKPRSRRQVISFNEALENLKASQTDSVACGAFNSFGRCRKQITLDDPKLLASLDQFDINDVQTPIKLMPLMLCSSHWGKTVYNNALFLDWLSVYGSKREDIHVENIVIDYQSAIVIHNGENSSSETTTLSGPAEENRRRPVSAPNSRTEEGNHPSVSYTMDQPQKHGDADESFPTVAESGVTAQVPPLKDGYPDELNPIGAESGHTAQAPRSKDGDPNESSPIETDTDGTPQIPAQNSVPVSVEPYASIESGVAKLDISPDESSPNETNSGHTPQVPPQSSVPAGMDSYASIELGVAKLEILYRNHLNCIAMTLNGWRCSTLIHQEELLRARELLSSSAASGSELDMQLLPKLVLCSKHALGSLPQIYSEKWSAFLEQRLRRDEAMSNANSRVFAKFLTNDSLKAIAFRTKPQERPRSAIALSAHGKGIFRFKSAENIGVDSAKAQTEIRRDPQREKVENVFKPATVVMAVETKDVKTSSNFLSPGSEAITASRRQLSLEPEGAKTGSNALSPESEAITESSIPFDQNTESQGSPAQASETLSSSQSINQPLEPYIPIGIVDQTLITEMSLPVSRKSYVHIIKPRNSTLIKFAATGMGKQQHESQYELKDSDEVRVTSLPTAHPERAMRLACLELQNFRAKQDFKASHTPGNNDETLEQEQEEWFDVPESMALLSVCMWCDFVRDAYSFDGTIKETWAERLTLLPKPSTKETELLEKTLEDRAIANRFNCSNDYHIERYQRYEGWIKEGLPNYS